MRSRCRNSLSHPDKKRLPWPFCGRLIGIGDVVVDALPSRRGRAASRRASRTASGLLLARPHGDVMPYAASSNAGQSKTLGIPCGPDQRRIVVRGRFGTRSAAPRLLPSDRRDLPGTAAIALDRPAPRADRDLGPNNGTDSITPLDRSLLHPERAAARAPRRSLLAGRPRRRVHLCFWSHRGTAKFTSSRGTSKGVLSSEVMPELFGVRFIEDLEDFALLHFFQEFAVRADGLAAGWLAGRSPCRRILRRGPCPVSTL